MLKACRLFILLFLLVSVKAGFSATTCSDHTSETKAVQWFSMQKQDPAKGLPSRGFALLILRYNEKETDRGFVLHNVSKSIVLSTIEDGSRPQKTEASVSALYFTSKVMSYEEFFYALPLRSPPVLFV